MRSIVSSCSLFFSLVVAFSLAGCPPTTATCPAGFVLASDGRCVAMGDAGPSGDGSVGHDSGMPMIDAGTGPDGCALHTYFADTDGDGYGDASAAPTFACEMPTGFVTMGGDCDDTCATCHPGAMEVCEGSHDENCDGHVDEGCGCTAGQSRPCGMSSMAPCHMGTQMCAGGTWGTCTGNVDPTTETCNAVDDDCDGTTDEGLTLMTWYPDNDGDGFGAEGPAVMACMAPPGYVASMNDCNDSSELDFPGNAEVCDGIDNNCNGTIDTDGAGLQCTQGAMGIACTTVCGSAATTTCSSTCTLGACVQPVESCNGTDDDCDGTADEGIGIVGSGTCLGSCTVASPTRVSPHLVALSSGYALVFTSSSQDQFYSQLLAADGTPMGSVIPLGVGAHPTVLGPATFDVAFDGTNVVIAYTHETGTDYNAYMRSFVPATGAIVWDYTVPLPSGRTADYQVRLVGAASNRVTLYVEQVATASSTHDVRRYRFNTAGTAPNLLYQVDALSGLAPISNGGAWDALAVNGSDVVVYRSTTGDLVMASGPTGDATTGTFTSVGTLQTAAQQPNVTTVALAVRSTSTAVSATNPLGIAWQRDSGNGTYIAQLSSITSATTSTPTQLPGSHGAPNVLGIARWLTLFAVPDASTYMNLGLFYVVSVEDDTTTTATATGSLAVWEASTDPTAPSQSALAAPSETSHSRFDISVAMSGTSIRLAEENATGNVVTRQLGCR